MSTDRRDRIRLVTMNLWWNGPHATERLAAAARLLNDLRPDVVALQECGEVDGVPFEDKLAAELGMHAYASRSNCTRGRSCSVVLSALPMTSTTELRLPAYSEGGVSRPRAIVAELVAPSGRPLHVVSTHLAWGGRVEWARLAEAQYIERWLTDRHAVLGLRGYDAITVLAGDLNTPPESDTMRWLTGLSGRAPGTFWVDAWAAAGHGAGATSTPRNEWAQSTAQRAGIIAPQRLPDRRIDYVLVRGWVYGRPGCVLSADLVGNTPVDVGTRLVLPSDHYGVVVDLWDPALP